MTLAPRVATWLVILAVGFAACSDADGNVGLRTSDEDEQAEIGEVEAPEVIGGEVSEDSSENQGVGDENAVGGTDSGTSAGGVAPSDIDDQDEEPTQPVAPVGPPRDRSNDPDDDPDDEIADDPAAEGRIDVSYPSAPVTDLRSGDEVDLAGQLAGRDKRTLLWFWQPGAGPSEAEAAVVARLEDELGDSIDVIALGTGGDVASARTFISGAGFGDVTILWDGSAEAVEYYEVTQLPSSILLDVNGDIIGRWETLSPEVFQLVRILS